MKGILFKPEMIRAIVEGRKTQTRRLAGLEEINQDSDAWVIGGYRNGVWGFGNLHCEDDVTAKPRYQVGDVVYIKEAWGYYPASLPEENQILFKSDNIPDRIRECTVWRSPMFLKEIHARRFIKITAVRAERLQEITEDDAKAEGCQGTQLYLHTGRIVGVLTAKSKYRDLWDSINKENQWASNPWVWVYTFNPITREGAGE